MTCPNCGTEGVLNARFCGTCGNRLDPPDRSPLVDSQPRRLVEGSASRAPLVPLEQRIGASIIEFVVLPFLMITPVSLLLGIGFAYFDDMGGNWLYGTPVIPGMYMALWLYTLRTGQSPMKRALRMKIVRSDGTACDWPRAFGRDIVYKFGVTAAGAVLGVNVNEYFGFAGIGIVVVGATLAFFTERHQGLHDKLFDTIVVRVEREPKAVA